MKMMLNPDGPELLMSTSQKHKGCPVISPQQGYGAGRRLFRGQKLHGRRRTWHVQWSARDGGVLC